MKKTAVIELKKVLRRSFGGTEETGGGKEYRYFHGVYVAKITQEIIEAEKIKLDKELLWVTALFHDIGKIKALDEKLQIDYQSEGNLLHDEIEVKFLRRYIGRFVDDEVIGRVAQIIGEKPSLDASLECKVLRDADELSNFGAMQMWRMATDAALTGKNLAEAIEYWDGGGIEQLGQVIEKMFFEYSKKRAKKELKMFIEAIKSLKRAVR